MAPDVQHPTAEIHKHTYSLRLRHLSRAAATAHAQPSHERREEPLYVYLIIETSILAHGWVAPPTAHYLRRPVDRREQLSLANPDSC